MRVVPLCMRALPISCLLFSFNDTAPTEIYTVSLHDALPIYADWAVADLTTDVSAQDWYRAGFDAALIDPPRSGALEVLPVIASSGARRVVYVSCNPATLARDAGALVDRHGFRLVGAGIADMFPHTAHTESIALFERP